MTRPLPPTGPASGPRRAGPRQAGQATPLLALALALAAVLVLALARGGAVAVDAARARTAADAAALAAAAEGREAAARVATANGATLEDVTQDGPDVVVSVRVGEVGAEARARQEGTWCPTDDGARPGTSYTSGSCRSSPG